MELTLLHNGGKDSSLVALLPDIFYDVTLVTAYFGAARDWIHARDAAAELGYAFETLKSDRKVAAAATARMVEDGYLRGGIQHVHEHALGTVCGSDFNAAADDTRRDDCVPSISRTQTQSLEDHHGVDHLSSLSRFGRDAVDRFVESHLDMETDPFEEILKADYEGEFRHLIAIEHEQAMVDKVFPDHVQSYVHGRY